MSEAVVTVQKKKGKKTYEEILSEFEDWAGKGANVYVPEMCEALHSENPGWTPNDIKSRVIRDCERFASKEWIRHFWPDWMKEQKFVEMGKKSAEVASTKRQQALELMRTTSKQLPKPKPVEQPQEQEDDTEDEELTDTGPLLESHGEPEDDKNVMDFIKEVNISQHALWKALTRNDTMPHVHEDITLDHIKPTRKFRKDLVDKTPGMDRAGISRRCGYLVEVLQDMIEIIDEAEKK